MKFKLQYHTDDLVKAQSWLAKNADNFEVEEDEDVSPLIPKDVLSFSKVRDFWIAYDCEDNVIGLNVGGGVGGLASFGWHLSVGLPDEEYEGDDRYRFYEKIVPGIYGYCSY